TLTAAGPGDWNDVPSLRQDPGEGELRRRTALRPGDLPDALGELQVLFQVLPLETRIGPAPVVLREIIEVLDLAGEKAAAERAVSHDPAAELPAGEEDPVLDIAAPQRVLRLEGRDRMHRRRPAQGVGRRLGETEMAHLPLFHQ